RHQPRRLLARRGDRHPAPPPARQRYRHVPPPPLVPPGDPPPPPVKTPALPAPGRVPLPPPPRGPLLPLVLLPVFHKPGVVRRLQRQAHPDLPGVEREQGLRLRLLPRPLEHLADVVHPRALPDDAVARRQDHQLLLLHLLQRLALLLRRVALPGRGGHLVVD